MYKWPLNISNFTWLDRLKICGFYLNPNNRWTMDKYVKQYESKMAEFIGCKYAIYVSSGSTANILVSNFVKDSITKLNPQKNIVLVPSTTWVTSVSPFIRDGFEIKFVDISLTDFSMNLNTVENILRDKKFKNKIACIFVTSLLGFSPDILELKRLELVYDVKIMLDNCESTFTKFSIGNENKNISSFFTSTTSTYFGHNITSGTGEGGFIFTNDEKEYEYFIMARNHGMIRSLPEDKQKPYRNKSVDSRFDFSILGNNYRNTEISAFGGLLDLKRANKYILKRRRLYNHFYFNTNRFQYILPSYWIENCYNVPFSIPIIINSKKKSNKIKKINAAKKICEDLQIETRPIVGQNLLRQTCFKEYGNPKDFPISEILHNDGFYVGLHPKIKYSQIEKLYRKLNEL